MDALNAFIAAPLEERLSLVREDPPTASAVRDYLGAGAFERYVMLAESVKGDHLAVDSPINIVFVPGVMGSLLRSEKLGGVWWIDARTRKHIEDLRLTPDGRTDYDARSAIVLAGADTSYEPFLKQILDSSDFNHRSFAFDWRKSMLLSTDELRRAIEDVYASNGQRPVHLVGHSMGGLMIRATLMRHGDALWPKLGRVCFIATPHYGSVAIAGYLKNHFWGWDMLILLRKYLSRAAFRSLWGVMELLPAPAGVYPGSRNGGEHPCGNFDFYDAAAWHLDLGGEEQAQLQVVLDGAAAFHRELFDHHNELDPELRLRMAQISGVGKKTLFRLEFREGVGRLWKEMNKITDRRPGDPNRDGDGRVSLASAELENLREMRYVRGTHGDLPSLAPVAEDVLLWLREEPMRLPATADQALSAHLGAEADADGEDPGFLDPLEDEPTAEQLDELDAALQAGSRPDFIEAKVL